MNKTPSYIQIFNNGVGLDCAYFSNKQLKLSGNILEYKVYGRHFSLNANTTFRGLKTSLSSSELSTDILPPVLDSDEIKNKVLRRARMRIRDYVNCNAGFHFSSSGRSFRPVFLTLTFSSNIISLSVANPLFTSFVRSLSFELFADRSLLRYLAVPEFQSRGAVHYHIVFFNLPFIRDVRGLFGRLWVHGFFHIKAVDRVQNLGRYISKYLSKDFVGRNIRGRKCYFVSAGLLKPVVVNHDEIINSVLGVVPDSMLEYEKKNIPLIFLVSMDYQSFNLQSNLLVAECVRSLIEV